MSDKLVDRKNIDGFDDQIKPCPFCGGKAILEKITGSWGYRTDTASISCAKCDIGFKEELEDWSRAIGHFSIAHIAIPRLIERWNKRS